MSKEYGVHAYAMILTKETMNMLAKAVYGKEEDFEENFKKCPLDFYQGLEEKFYLSSISEFTGEACFLQSDGSSDYSVTETFSGDTIYYCEFNNGPLLFDAAYESIDEIVDEMRDRFGEYLPDDFNYRTYLREIIGSYYG